MLLAVILYLAIPSAVRAQTTLYSDSLTSDFSGYTPYGTQPTTGFSVADYGSITGWTVGGVGSGLNSVKVNGTWVPGFYEGFSTTLETTTAISGANQLGVNYSVTFQIAPNCSNSISQATGSTDGFVLKVLSGSNVVAQGSYLPGSFASSASASYLPFKTVTLDYTGNGQGNPNLDFSCVNAGANAFAGALENVVLQELPSFIWTGTASSNWNTTDQNWNNGSGQVVTYSNGLPVQFDDTAGTLGGSTSVVISGSGVAPSLVTFNNNAYNYTLQSPGAYGITGTGSLVKNGSGMLTLGGTSSYTGLTTINGGTLAVSGTAQIYNHSSALENTPLTINSGAMLEVQYFGYGGNLGELDHPAANLVINGGTISFTGTDSTQNSRAFTIGALGATLNNTTAGVNRDIGVVGGNFPLVSSSSGLLTLMGVGNGEVDKVIPGSGGVSVVGPGMWTFTAANTYTGGTTVSAGTLAMGTDEGANENAGSLGSGTVSISGGAQLRLGGYPGGTTVTYNIPNNITVNNGTIAEVDGAQNLNGTLTIGAGGAALNSQWTTRSLNVVGVMSGSGALAIGTLASVNGGNVTFSSSNSYSGTVSLNGGVTISLSNANAFANANVNVNNAALVYGQSTAAFGSLSGTGAFTLPSGMLTLGGNNQSTTYSGIMSGSGGLTVTGLGSLTLGGSNTYSGGTTISAGTLALATGGALGVGNLTVASGGVLAVSNFTSGYNFAGGTLTAGRISNFATDIKGSINLNNTTVNWPGSNATMTISGSLGGGGATLNYAVGDSMALGGALNLTGTDYVAPLAALSSGTYTLFTYNSGTPNLNDFATSGIFGTNPRQSYTFGTSGGSAVTLTVQGVAGNLQWIGTSGNVWYSGTSSTANWYNTVGNSADYFYNGDNVTFSDSGSAAQTVIISGTVQPASLTVSNTNASYTFSGTGSIGGITALVMNGPGSLTITTSNTYTGATMINGGTLEIGNGGGGASIGSTSGVSDNGALIFSHSDAVTFSPAIGGSGSLTQNGTGLLVLTASNSITGTIVIGGGTLQIGNGGGGASIGLASSVSDSGILAFNHNDSVAFALAVSGSGGLVQSGSGLLLLTGTKRYTGPTTVSGGTLQLGDGASGHDCFLATSGISDNATLAYNSGGSQTAPYVIGGSGALVKAGSGALTLGGANTYSGATTVIAGTLQLTNTNALALSSSLSMANGTTLQLRSNNAGTFNTAPTFISSSSTVAINVDNNGSGSSNPLTLGGGFTYSGGANASSELNITGSDGYTLSMSTLTLSHGGNFAPTFTLYPTTASLSVGSLQYSYVAAQQFSLHLDGTSSGNSVSASTSIQWLDVTKNGTGAWTWNPVATAATNLNNVTINSGTFIVNGTLVAGTSAAQRTITLAGGTFDYNSAGAVNIPAGDAPMTFSGGSLDNTSGTAITTSTYNPSMAWNADWTFIGSNGANSNLNLGTGTVSLGTAAGTTRTLTIQNAATSLTVGGAISNGTTTHSLAKAGSGTLLLGGVNTFSGGTTVQNGTLQLGNSAALGTGSLTANHGTVDLAGYNPTVGGLGGVSGVITNSSTTAATLSVSQTTSTTFGGLFRDGAAPVGLTLAAGTLMLNGSDTNSGPTTISAGALIAGGANTLSPNSSVTFISGLLDVTAGSQSVAGFTMTGGTLNLNLNNLLSVTGGTATFGGALNIQGTPSGSIVDLMSYLHYIGSFSTSTSESGYNLVYTPTELELVKAVTGPAAWSLATSGSWTVGTNWSTGTSPTGVGTIAVLGTATTSPTTISLDSPQTVGTLTFANSAGYTLTAGSAGSLTLDNTGGSIGGQIIVLSGTHSIAAPLIISNSAAYVSIVSSGRLDISGNIGQSGGSQALSLSSSDATGVLSLDGSNSFSGGVYVNSGTLILNGAAALASGSTLVIGATSSPSVPSVISSPVTAPTLASVPEPGTLTLFIVCVIAMGIGLCRRNAAKLKVQCTKFNVQ